VIHERGDYKKNTVCLFVCLFVSSYFYYTPAALGAEIYC